MKIILVSGVPGSGKTQEVNRLVKEIGENYTVVVTVNDFFLSCGTFHYVHLALPYAQEQAQEDFSDALYRVEQGEDIRAIIVEDIFSSLSEISYYVMAAKSYGYSVEVVTMECDPATAIARQVHGMRPGYIVCRDRDLRARQIPDEWEVTQRTVQVPSVEYPASIS